MPQHHIPRFHQWLFRQLCKPELYSELAGDLEEAFEENKQAKGITQARQIYKKEVLKMLRPSVIRPFRIFQQITSFDMFKNYLKLSFRNLWRDKEHSLVSIMGLAAGIVASVLIFQYVNFENSFDKQHDLSKGDVYRVSRVSTDLSSGEVDSRSAHHYLGIQKSIVQEVPEVQSATHLFPVNGVFTLDDTGHSADNVYCTTGSFFEVFDFELLQGNMNDLDLPGTVFLSQTLATRIFGTGDPMDRLLRYNDINSNVALEVVVKGIYADFPANSSFDAPALLPARSLVDFAADNWFPTMEMPEIVWRWVGFHTFIKTIPKSNQQRLNQKVVDFVLKHRAPYNANQGRDQSVQLHTLAEAHFLQDFEDPLKPAGNRSVLQLFFGVGVLVVLIAWVNFINLAAARAGKRAKEVGVRKYMGAHRGSLIVQFLTEALLINLMALVLAAGLIVLVLPQFHQLIGFPAFDYFTEYTSFWILYLGLFLVGALLSGIYPALVLTRFEPIKVLRGNFSTSAQGIWLRRALMFGQFSIVLILLSGILVIRSQISFMMNHDLGMNLEQTLVIDAPPAYLRDSTYTQRLESLRGELEQNPAISGTAISSMVPGQRNQFFQTINRADRPSDESVLLYRSFVNEDFIPFYGLKLLSGRGFDSDLRGDRSVVLINEEARKRYDFASPEEAVGKRLAFPNGQQPRIIGVVADFKPMGVKFAVEPLALELDTLSNAPFLNVRLSTEDLTKTVKFLESSYQELFPAAPFEATFLDQSFDEVYREDRKFRSVLEFFAVVAIFIACIGVFGLSSFLINQKLKEVSIRKVLGAGIVEILKVLTSEYLLLVGLATLIAVPLAYLWAGNWLSGFLVNVGRNPILFFLPVAVLLVILLITIGRKTWFAARVNPAKTLKDE